MEAKKYPMTQEALDRLRAELDHKITVEKPALAARLKHAISMGDLSENADYHAAKEDQGFLEGRIKELEELIRGAAVIDENNRIPGVVGFGSIVTIQEVGEDETEEFMLVGKVEADPRKGKISDESPIGKALMGHKKGDRVVAQTPGGNITFKIIKVE